MPTHKRRPAQLAIICCVVFAAVLLSLRITAQQISRETLAEIAKQPNGLREAARLAGHYVVLDLNTDDRPRSFVSYVAKAYSDLSTMAADSDAVVVAVPIDEKPRLSESGTTIVTDYRVRIERDFKQKFQPGDTILVSIPGGKVEFPGGTSAEIITPNFPRMKTGNRYVIFVGPKDVSYRPTGGSQGIFELPPDGSGVKPFKSSFEASAIAAKSGEKPAVFLKEVEAAVDHSR